MGYDLERGRLDPTEHPFTIGSNEDVRVTTKYNPDDPRPALFSCIHEGGHALYEQGYHTRYKNTPLAEPCSLGIHESQSRLWENIIGRSIHFWKFYYPLIRGAFPSLSGMTLEQFHRSINNVKPSLIRVEADEVTYNLHILIRFELEMDLIAGKLDVKEIPQAWKDKYEEYLGIRPKTDREGCLQDIHWAMGAFGYFPTYALGNLYSAQFYWAMVKKHPEVEKHISEGDLRTVLVWLRTNIHEKGKLYPASELVEIVTGEPLNEDHFIDYLKEKYGTLYNVYF
jgi:carboxypeptidase Taq